MSEAKSSVGSVAGRSAGAGPEDIDSLGMNYLVSLPRRIVAVYLPLFVFVEMRSAAPLVRLAMLREPALATSLATPASRIAESSDSVPPTLVR